ncbi:hypothetical protein CVT26_004691 [Gymnopilus dilepis]|uniref:Heterokaryon incompatibility domain-containing protein n=1 Tax=Gymnopilus dilepis TaxID=231916 RepID=A0A409XZB0_9AGAR|nr:hypothetical protein CVT26_004691 [Gymnopilus dilepis]
MPPPRPQIIIEDSDDWESESQGHESETEEGIKIPRLLPVPSDLAKPGDNLCSVCSQLELTPRRFVVLPSDNERVNKPDDPSIQLGLVEDIRKKAHCPFCRLILVALGGDIPSVEDGEPVIVTMSWNTDGPKPDENAPWSHIPQVRILRPYARKQNGGYVNRKGNNMFPEITMLANDAPTPSKAFLLRFIPDQIDFDIVRNWLHMCSVWHGAACDRSEMLQNQLQDPASSIPHFRLIDVVDNCIVQAPRGAKYATLSYVWGRIDPSTILRCLKENHVALAEPGSLLLPENHGRIPLTIRDAIQVTRELRLRYLWVDSLCIIQDDSGPGGSKMSAIANMDLVYGGAYLTIMAATGTDANAGLPGLRPGTRGTTQPIEEVLPELRLGFRESHLNYLNDATYFTRAWTFQEQRFTKRTLLFIGGQVVYQCRRTNAWREDVFFEERTAKFGSVASHDRDINDIGQYEGLIQSYSGLSLTFDTDIYHGFAGLARYFSTALRAELCHGIPDAYFDWFLLWYPLEVQRRRGTAPSWSWSGWYGQSWPNMWNWYTRDRAKVRKALRYRTWIIWYQRKAHDSDEFHRVWTPKTRSTTMTPRNFYGSHVRSRFPFDCSQTSPTPRTLTRAPDYIEDSHNRKPGSGFLQFWTVSATFKIDKSKSREGKPGPKNHNTRMGIFGRDRRELGVVFVEPGWGEANRKKKHEFILLCEGRDVRAENGRFDDEPGWRYKVMLIEWHGEWAERVAVGSIGKEDLDQALGDGAVWKEIVLG